MERGVADVAIRLLPHLEKPVRRVAGVGIVGKEAALQRKWSVRQRIEILYARIRIGLFEGLGEFRCGAGGQQVQIAGVQRGLDCRQQGRRACPEGRSS